MYRKGKVSVSGDNSGKGGKSPKCGPRIGMWGRKILLRPKKGE